MLVLIRVVTVLKGAGTIIAGLDGSAYINPTGNPGMASAGAGDVLTGMIASLISQGMNCTDAARAGVFLHGLAGDIAAGVMGKEAVTASDLINYLPEAFKSVNQT